MIIDRLLLDLDGVLVQCAEGVHIFHGSTPVPYGQSTSYDLAAEIGITPKELWAPLGYDFWRNLEPLPHMLEFVALLEKAFGQENICILTSPITTPGCIEGKMDWIREHLPQYKRQFLVGPAKQFCAGERHALVDDYEGNVDKFEAAGGHTLLVPAPWNHRFAEDPMDALRQWLGSIS